MGYEVEVEEAVDLTLPEDSIHRARLEEIKKSTINWIDSRSNEPREAEIFEWWWQITQSSLGEQYVGRRVKGTTDVRSRAGDRFFRWAAALLDRDIPVGMKVDTDDLIGLSAEISIGHRPDKKDATKKWEYVDEVMSLSGSTMDEPPF